MKKYFIYMFCTALLILGVSCGTNPMYDDVISQEDYDAIIEQEGIVTVYAPAAQLVYIQFKDGEVLVDVEGSSDSWHLYSPDTTWRIGSNSGTTADATGSSGLGGVKVYTGLGFYDITSVDYTDGLINTTEAMSTANVTYTDGWAIDDVYDYSEGTMLDLNLNYYLTKSLYNNDTRNRIINLCTILHKL